MSKKERVLFSAYQLTLALERRLFLDESCPGEFEVRSGRKIVVEVPTDAKTAYGKLSGDGHGSC